MAPLVQPYQTEAVADFLVQLHEQGTPLRVDSETETYYVLTATQLQHLLLSALTDTIDLDFANNQTFTPEEFGLTEADITAYEAKQQQQRAALNLAKQQPPDPKLIERLNALPRFEQLFPQRAAIEREALLRELETAMLTTLRSVLPAIEQA